MKRVVNILLVNILLLGVVLLGIAMMADTFWGLAVALVPFAIWGARFLFFIHKSFWAAVIFWGGIAYFQWQVSLAVGTLFGLIWFIRFFRRACKHAPPCQRQVRQKPAIDEFMGSLTLDPRYNTNWDQD